MLANPGSDPGFANNSISRKFEAIATNDYINGLKAALNASTISIALFISSG